MTTPFPYRKESKLFGDALLKLAHDSHRNQISQYVSNENVQSLHHGRGWLTVRENGTEETTLGEASVELKVDYTSIANNDIQTLFKFISDFVEGFTSQIVAKMFKTLSDACDKSGNVVKQSDHTSKAAAFLATLKTIEFSVNENGEVELPQLHIPPDGAQAFFDELNSQGEEFNNEVAIIKKEKSAAAIEKERSRLSKYKAINL
ncbi:MAG: hypothetical protein DID90_2727554269 [Candidatus Nitrotoga sp. LAW]|nr:MAG: hypothetical protein DID90_2727554269 [Candidatus Nitrotoga sp. LAW]